jgi:uncharacterized protein (TIGR04255 family)
LAQIKFPQIISIERREFVGPFQEAIRDAYPRTRVGQQSGIILGPGGLTLPAKEAPTWRFMDTEDRWKVTLGSTFLSIETTAYSSRNDFLNRLRFVAGAASETIKPKLMERLGLRYIDRLVQPEIEQLSELVSPPVLGLITANADMDRNIEHSITETGFALSDGRITARWGLLPANATIDPNLLPPVEERSWILDLDMFVERQGTFDVPEMMRTFDSFACRLYTLFRWAVTPRFLRTFGGNP